MSRADQTSESELDEADIEPEFSRLYPNTNGPPAATLKQKRALVIDCLEAEKRAAGNFR